MQVLADRVVADPATITCIAAFVRQLKFNVVEKGLKRGELVTEKTLQPLNRSRLLPPLAPQIKGLELHSFVASGASIKS